ncbi:MAG: hypothetical protein OSA99_18720 [Acidimicrobiales bacterium]|nr:hypothetical protein [Acidimicrobiales bacterium]
MPDRPPIVIDDCEVDGSSAVGHFRICDEQIPIRFSDVAPEPDTAVEAFAAIGQIMGMETHQSVVCRPRLSRTYHRTMSRFQAIHVAHFPDQQASPVLGARWPRGRPRRERPVDPATDDRRVGAFFSGGVDSLDLLVEWWDEIDDLVFVRGFDIEPDDVARNDDVTAWVRAEAEAAGKPLLVLETDIRRLLVPRSDWTWTVYGGLIATAILLGRTHRLVMCAASVADRHLPPEAHGHRASPFGNERSVLRIEGRIATRVEKLERVAASGLAKDSLRVCWQNVPGTINCGVCDKCTRTLVGLAAIDRLGHFSSLPDTVDLDRVAAHPAITRSDRAYLIEARDAAASTGHADVVEALDTALRVGAR